MECRYWLATRILTRAGEARRLAAAGEIPQALAAIGPETWLDAWESVAGRVGRRIVASAGERREAVASAVGMSARMRRRYRLGEVESRAIIARLGVRGAGLVADLGALEAASLELAKDPRPDLETAWQGTLIRVARRLEAAWLGLEKAAAEERARLEGETARIAAWRKSLWPVFAFGVLILGIATYLGLILGGYVSPPGWFPGQWIEALQ